jgi:hypothetical protein
VAPGAKKHQWSPAVAFDHKGAYLVVWREGSGIRGGDADIHAARVDASGKVLDAKPIVISEAADFQKRPAVAWAGKHWLVVWQDARAFKEKGYDIYAARVSAEGKLLDPKGIVVRSEKADQQMPAVASDGTGSLILWADYRSGKDYDVYGCVLRNGKPGAVSAILPGKGPQVSPSVAWTGEAYLVCATRKTASSDQNQGACILRVAPDGKPLGEVRMSGGQGSGLTTSLAFAGQHGILTVTTQIGKGYEPTHCYALFLNADGSIARPADTGRGGFKEWRALRGTPAIRMTGTKSAPGVYASSAADSGQWLLGLYDVKTGWTKSRGRGRVPKPAVRYTVVRAADGGVTAEGELAKGMRAAAGGDGNGTFLVAYEQHGTDHKIAFRMLRAR